MIDVLLFRSFELQAQRGDAKEFSLLVQRLRDEAVFSENQWRLVCLQSFNAAADGNHEDVMHYILEHFLRHQWSLQLELLYCACRHGRERVVKFLFQHSDIYLGIRDFATFGHCAASGKQIEILGLLMQDKRCDFSYDDSSVGVMAAEWGDFRMTDLILQDERVDGSLVISQFPAARRHEFQYRALFTEICIGLQSLRVPAWQLVCILDEVRPHCTLTLYQKWQLVCAVKHFRDRRQEPDSNTAE